MKFKNIPQKKSRNHIKRSVGKKKVEKNIDKANNPRGFTERLPRKKDILPVLKTLKKMAIIFVFSVILVFILFIAGDLYKNFVLNRQVQAQRQKLVHEINIWKSFSDKYQGYKEVYFQIAVRQFQLGDFKTAREYLQKALFIDPNYEEALKLQKELESK